jgi:voltage-gated potassium channel Kch
VLIGLTFATIFIAIDVLGDINFATPPSMNSAPDLLYLSFITLTTVGFGDIVAAHDLGRAMLVLEAVIGQIFLITLVARLVAMFGEEQRKGR